jgi:hypothetical protein
MKNLDRHITPLEEQTTRAINAAHRTSAEKLRQFVLIVQHHIDQRIGQGT